MVLVPVASSPRSVALCRKLSLKSPDESSSFHKGCMYRHMLLRCSQRLHHLGIHPGDPRFNHFRKEDTHYLRQNPWFFYSFAQYWHTMPSHLMNAPPVAPGLRRLPWLKAPRSPMDPATHEVFRETDVRTETVFEWAYQSRLFLSMYRYDTSNPLYKLEKDGIVLYEKVSNRSKRGFPLPAPLLPAPDKHFDPNVHETFESWMDPLVREASPDQGGKLAAPTQSGDRWHPRLKFSSLNQQGSNRFLEWVRQIKAALPSQDRSLFNTPAVQWNRREWARAEEVMTRVIADYLEFSAVFPNGRLAGPVPSAMTHWHVGQKSASPGLIFRENIRSAHQLEEHRKAQRRMILRGESSAARFRPVERAPGDSMSTDKQHETDPTTQRSGNLSWEICNQPDTMWDFADVWDALNERDVFGPREWMLIHYWMDRYWPVMKHFANPLMKYASRPDIRTILASMPLMPVWMQETLLASYEERLGPSRFDWVEMYELHNSDPLRFTPSRLARIYQCSEREAMLGLMHGDMWCAIRDNREFDHTRWFLWLKNETIHSATSIFHQRDDLFKIVNDTTMYRQIIQARARRFEDIVKEDIPRPQGGGYFSNDPDAISEAETYNRLEVTREYDRVPSWLGPLFETPTAPVNHIFYDTSKPWMHPFEPMSTRDPNYHLKKDLRRVIVHQPDGTIRSARDSERIFASEDYFARHISWNTVKAVMAPRPGGLPDGPRTVGDQGQSRWFNRLESDTWKFVENVGALEQNQEDKRWSGAPDMSLSQMYNAFHTPAGSGIPLDFNKHFRAEVMAKDAARWSRRH